VQQWIAYFPDILQRRHIYILLSIYQLKDKMGNCFKPSSNYVLSHLDDSVKVMVRHDAEALKKKGEKPSGYVPRAPHPLVDSKTAETPKETAETPKETAETPKETAETPKETAETPKETAETPKETIELKEDTKE